MIGLSSDPLPPLLLPYAGVKSHRSQWPFSAICVASSGAKIFQGHVTVRGVTDVNERNETRHDISDVSGFVVISHWDLQMGCRNCFFPSQTHVGCKNGDRANVESHPASCLKNFK